MIPKMPAAQDLLQVIKDMEKLNIDILLIAQEYARQEGYVYSSIEIADIRYTDKLVNIVVRGPIGGFPPKTAILHSFEFPLELVAVLYKSKDLDETLGAEKINDFVLAEQIVTEYRIKIGEIFEESKKAVQGFLLPKRTEDSQIKQLVNSLKTEVQLKKKKLKSQQIVAEDDDDLLFLAEKLSRSS